MEGQQPTTMSPLDQQINSVFPGLVVRKDLVKLVKGNAIVPSYVLEYLLGQYAATPDEAAIQSGIETVKNILATHYVHRNEAGLVRSTIRERGRHRVIDKVGAALNDKRDVYEATFANLGIKQVLVDTDTVKRHPKLLVSGVWSISDVEYEYSEDKEVSPWVLGSIKPIQLSRFDYDGYLVARRQFSTDEWIDLLLQSMGFNPEFFDRRSKLTQLVRLIPYCERNYNLIELGPKGTGKSHIYSEFSPHGILISGGEVTVAKLFVNNATGRIGLVGYWDVVAFDEFAGRGKRVDKSLVDILKNYMANKSFSRGIETLGAEASTVFLGNTQHTLSYMLRHSNLFDELPKEYYDSAFLDRLHFYIPGWEMDIIRGEMFSDGYGFVVDYLAEILRYLRNYDYSQLYAEHFELSEDISTRDRTAIQKTFSGLVKIIFPHQEATPVEIEELLRFAIEGRKRIKDQLMRIDPTYAVVSFGYRDNRGAIHLVRTREEEQYPQYFSTAGSSGDEDEDVIWPEVTPPPENNGEEVVDSGGALPTAIDLIKQGEGQHVEFKSSFQWDTRKLEQALYLRDEIVKTVAAFLNSEGGTLLIGVKDDGTVLGIEPDLNLQKGHARDQFELQLTRVIADNVGTQFAKFVRVSFEVLDGSIVCLVNVKASPKAVYVDGKGFWVRSNNASRELTIAEAIEYIKMHWG